MEKAELEALMQEQNWDTMGTVCWNPKLPTPSGFFLLLIQQRQNG
jgi:hypothetical protein